MGLDTLKALLITKFNIHDSCSEFCDQDKP